MPLRSIAWLQRLAHALVLQGILAVGIGDAGRRFGELVEGDVDEAARDGLRQGDLRIRPELGKVVRRRVFDQVDIAGQQGGHAVGAIGERPEDDLRPGRLRPPIGVVALQHERAAALPGNELERPGADQPFAAVELGRRLAFRRAAGRRLVRQDGQAREIDRQQRRGGGCMDAQGQRIDDLEARELPRDHGEGPRAVGHLGRALESEDHVFGAEVRSVVELHAGPQLELPLGIADRLP